MLRPSYFGGFFLLLLTLRRCQHLTQSAVLGGKTDQIAKRCVCVRVRECACALSPTSGPVVPTMAVGTFATALKVTAAITLHELHAVSVAVDEDLVAADTAVDVGPR